MGQIKEVVVIESQVALADGVYSMWIQTDMAVEAKPGQFISVFSRDGAKLLPRPISICEIDPINHRLRIVYRVVGSGTTEFAQYQSGEQVSIMGPLGNGFPLKDKKTFVIGGGIGIPPMLELAKQLTGEVQVILGYRDALFMNQEFAPYGQVYLATEDGSAGTAGNVIDAIGEQKLDAEVIYACGPTPMLKAIKTYALAHNIECWLSLEERMACGIGACLACVCQSADIDEHTFVHNKRVCKDGPVFLAEEVEFL